MMMPKRRIDGGFLAFRVFRGTLSLGDDRVDVRFKVRLRPDGELQFFFYAIPLTRQTLFIRERWHARDSEIAEFSLVGTADDAVRFETDNLHFSTLGQRWSGVSNRHSLRPKGQCSHGIIRWQQPEPVEQPVLKFYLKGFECFPAVHAGSPLGRVVMAGQTTMDDPDQITGWLAVKAGEMPEDIVAWREKADQLLEHVRRIMSVGASAYLRAPIIQFASGSDAEMNIYGQSRQPRAVMRSVHKLHQQPIFEAAIRSFFSPPVAINNLFFAIEWFTMASSYNEVRLVTAMTALENLIDANIGDEERFLPEKVFAKTAKALRSVIRACLAKWSEPDLPEDITANLSAKLGDLNRRSLRQKVQILATRWGVPLDGIEDSHIRAAIGARNHVVHRGLYEQKGLADLWDHMTLIRELVVRFLLTAIGYKGDYISHWGGYHLATFPPIAASAPSDTEQ